jgi:hypothetical protein
LQLSAFLPAELAGFLKKVEDDPAAAAASNKSGNPAIGKIK